jgi:hypothetical protein
MITKTEIGNQPVAEGNKASSLVSKFYLCIVGYWKLTFNQFFNKTTLFDLIHRNVKGPRVLHAEPYTSEMHEQVKN